MNKKHEAHEDHEAVSAYGGKYLFCSDLGFTKQIITRAFGRFCLMLPHIPHELVSCLTSQGENMRIMRIYEEGLFNGIYLPCIEMGVRSRPKHEAVMRMYEADLHVLGAGRSM